MSYDVITNVMGKLAVVTGAPTANATLEALTKGVPLVAIPVINDQSGVAARIAYAKIGRFVPLKELAVPRLTLLIDEVLRNSGVSREC
jgi:UDP:flavonoid glycosyltransferase YjiC (YdhE family)